VGLKTTYPPRRPVRRKRRPPPWISLRHASCRTPGTSLRVSALQTDRGRLRYIEPLACAYPPRVHDGAETASAISLKQASTIAEMRTSTCPVPQSAFVAGRRAGLFAQLRRFGLVPLVHDRDRSNRNGALARVTTDLVPAALGRACAGALHRVIPTHDALWHSKAGRQVQPALCARRLPSVQEAKRQCAASRDLI